MYISHDDLHCCVMIKCRISSWDLQNLLLKVMLENKWLNLVLDTDFMILSILELDFFLIFLEFIIHFRASSQH